jgi:hypothetical protein
VYIGKKLYIWAVKAIIITPYKAHQESMGGSELAVYMSKRVGEEYEYELSAAGLQIAVEVRVCAQGFI